VFIAIVVTYKYRVFMTGDMTGPHSVSDCCSKSVILSLLYTSNYIRYSSALSK